MNSTASTWMAKIEALRDILTSGGRSVAQVEDNCGALSFGPLTKTQMGEIEGILRRAAS